MRTLSALLMLTVAGSAFAQKEFGFDNRKPSGQPYLTPEETVKRFKVAPEFEVKLFAGEPKVVNPIAFTIDEKGRIWVVESFEYPKRTPKGQMPRDRIVILEDTDGDGVADKRTIFAEGKDFPHSFDMASGIEVGHGGVFLGAPPYLWFIENKNDKPGKFEVLLKGFGSQDTHETLNTFQWGPDGWLYGLHGVFTNSEVTPGEPGASATGVRPPPVANAPGSPAPIKMNAAVWRFHPRSKKFEIFAEGTSNPWGLDWRNTDGQFILACCVIPHLYHIVPGGIYKRQAGASFNPYAYGFINEICDHTFHRESGWAHAGLISLDVPHVPEKYRNSVIFGSIHGCSLKQNVLKPNGSTFAASRADDFLVSGDKNFRPINMKWGPLGDIYLIDWHDQNPCHQTKPDDWDYERGRVYRIQLKGTQPMKTEDLGKKSEDELIKLFKLGNPFEQRTALRLIAEPSPERNFRLYPDTNLEILPAPRFHWAVHAGEKFTAELWGKFHPKNVGLPLADCPPEFRWVIRFGTESGGTTANTIDGLAALAAEAKSILIRQELASASIRLAETHNVLPLIHAILKRKEDAKDPLIPHLIWVAYEKTLASGGVQPRRAPGASKDGGDEPRRSLAELTWLAANAPGNPLITDHILPRAMRRLAAAGKADDLAACVRLAADASDAAVRRQALTGLVEELKNRQVAPPPGWVDVQATLLKTDDAAIRDLVNKLAVSFRDPAAVARALKVLADEQKPSDVRVEAVRQLATLKDDKTAPAFVAMLTNDPHPAVQVEVARGLAAFDDPKLANQLLAGWIGYPRAVQAELVNTFAGRKAWAKLLLDSVAAKIVDRRLLTDNTILRIQAFNDKDLNALIEKAWGRSRPTPKELDALIEKMRGELAAGPGSFARGKLVFDNQCAKCHKFDGRGNEVGPQLDGAARDIEYILANVIDPNRVIGAPYFLRTVTTVDGRVEQGLLAAEDEQSITLKVENAQLKRIAKKDIEGPVKVVEKSMMPEGLTAGMSVQDFRDLVRYASANPFVTEVTVNGKPASAGVTGRIPPPGTDEVLIEAEVTATADLKTRLLIGAPGPFEVKLDGKSVGTGKPTERRVDPDQFGFDVELAKGPHKLTVSTVTKGSPQPVYVRLLDPERKLTYPEPKK